MKRAQIDGKLYLLFATAGPIRNLFSHNAETNLLGPCRDDY
jgi:hypothetical protein